MDSRLTVPELGLTDLDGKAIQMEEELRGHKSLLIHFDSDCSGCQKETEAILQHIDDFDQVHLYFVSAQDVEHIKTFETHYELGRYPNITVARDPELSVAKFFRSGTTPLSVLIDGERKVHAVFEGAAEPSELITMLNQID